MKTSFFVYHITTFTACQYLFKKIFSFFNYFFTLNAYMGWAFLKNPSFYPMPFPYEKVQKKEPLPAQKPHYFYFQYPYFFLLERTKTTESVAAANSAMITDAQIPSNFQTNGNSKTAPI